MPILSNAIDRIRRSGANPALQQQVSAGQFNYWDMRSPTGVDVTEESALGLTAYFRGVQLIASTIAGFPLHVYREEQDGTRKVNHVPSTAYLWQRPNNEMTKQSMWEHVIADEVRGNGFIWVDKNENGRPRAIHHLPRSWVRVGRLKSGLKVYEVANELPMIDYKEGGEIVHIPNWGNGLIGYNPIAVAKSAIALGISAQDYAERFFSQDSVPPGYITTAQTLTPTESEQIADRWQRRQAGPVNWRKIAVLGNGAIFNGLNPDPEKAQMQQLRTFQGEEVCRLLGIPPHMLGFTEKVTSWGSGIAEQGRGFVTMTLQSHLNRVEQAIDDALLVRELTQRFVKLDPDGLLRGTPMQRAQVYALGWGRWLTPDDIRRFEDLPPIDGGDTLPVGANLIPLEDVGKNLELTPPQNRPEQGDQPQ